MSEFHEVLTVEDIIKIKKFLIDNVTNENYPIINDQKYSRPNYSQWIRDWTPYLDCIDELCVYINDNDVLKKPSSLIHNKLIYRAAEKRYYDEYKKTFIPNHGRSQPLWFALDEKYAIDYYKSKPKGESVLIRYTLNDKTKSETDLYLLNLDGPPNMVCENERFLNMNLLIKMYEVVEKQIKIKNEDLYKAFGLFDTADKLKYQKEFTNEQVGYRGITLENDRIVVTEFMIIFEILEIVLGKKIIGYYQSNISIMYDDEKIIQNNDGKFMKENDEKYKKMCRSMSGEVAIDSKYFNKPPDDDKDFIVENVVEKFNFYQPNSRKRSLSNWKKTNTNQSKKGGKKTKKRKPKKHL